MNTLAIAISLIYMMESSSGRDVRNGDHGKSVGPLQIKKIVVDDVNRILKLQGIKKVYFYTDRVDFEKSKEMAEIYLSWYADAKRLQHEPHLRDYLGIWNQGPTGWNHLDGLVYYTKAITKVKKLKPTDALRMAVGI